jgi:hypothetical protein
MTKWGLFHERNVDLTLAKIIYNTNGFKKK